MLPQALHIFLVHSPSIAAAAAATTTSITAAAATAAAGRHCSQVLLKCEFTALLGQVQATLHRQLHNKNSILQVLLLLIRSLQGQGEQYKGHA
jgi:hypothetical protein